MIFGKTKLELKVGIFVFLGLTILAVFVLSIGGLKTWASGYSIHFIFKFVNGVKIGAPIRFAGVDVGEVKRISFMFPASAPDKTEVKITGWVKRDTRVPIDSTIWVNTLGLLGEKYIEIMPGKDYGRIAGKDEVLVGVDPIPMHEVVRLARNIINNLDDGIERLKNKEGTVGKLIYDDAIYKELEALVTDLRKNPWKLFYKTKEK